MNSANSQNKKRIHVVEYSGLEPLTSTLPFILSIKLCPLPAGFIVEAKSQLASSRSSQMS